MLAQAISVSVHPAGAGNLSFGEPVCCESCLTMSEAMTGYKAMDGKRRDSGASQPGPDRKHSFRGSLSNRPWNKCDDIHNCIIQEIDFTHKLGLDQ